MVQRLYNDNILVEEVKMDNKVDGILMSVDDENEPYMHVKVVAISDESRKELNDVHEGDTLIIRTPARTPYKENLYFISWKDVRGRI